jgi:RNA polymerase sigma-70 factor (ECF subfamily)
MIKPSRTKLLDFSTLEDTALMKLVAGRQTQALNVLYERYGRLVFSLAMGIVGDGALAEEITQDVFLQVWNKAYTYDADQARPSTWLTSVTRHRAIDVLRQRKDHFKESETAWEDRETEPANQDGLEHMVEIGQQVKRIRHALAHLPQEQKIALALAFYKGYTHLQIAERTGEPLGTIKTRIRLAMQKIRLELEEK